MRNCRINSGRKVKRNSMINSRRNSRRKAKRRTEGEIVEGRVRGPVLLIVGGIVRGKVGRRLKRTVGGS